jgi:hypothetical protein
VSDQDADRISHLALRVAEIGTARQVEDGLLGRGYHGSADLSAHPLGVEVCGAA